MNIMEDIHRICINNKIPYYLVAGSMIGAVRHNGFIPWDDDIDIAIPRPFYNKFLKIASKELKEHYKVNSFQTSNEYIYSFIKVEDTRTVVDFPWTSGCGLKEGLCIDVFVLDGTPRNKVMRSLYCYYIQRLIALKSALYMNEKHRPFIQKNVSRIFKYLIKIEKPAFLKFIDNQMKRFDYEKSEFAVNYSGLYGKKEIVHKSIFGKPTIYKFGKSEFYGVQNYDTYLTGMYGDYMTLPPIDKRRNHFNSVKFIS
jgi:lipopolysaccharide cholinephosphotransferase